MLVAGPRPQSGSHSLYPKFINRSRSGNPTRSMGKAHAFLVALGFPGTWEIFYILCYSAEFLVAMGAEASLTLLRTGWLQET